MWQGRPVGSPFSFLHGLVQAQRAQIAVTDRQALKRIALADILLHRIPLDTRAPTRLQNLCEVHIAFADFRHRLLWTLVAFGREHNHVLQMNDWHPARHAINPDHGIGAAMLQPIGIQLRLQEPRIGVVEDDVQPAALAKLGQFEAVIVIAERQAGGR